MSQEHTFVYSDFHIQIESVLKDRSRRLAEGSSILGYRQGGAMRFPSGHISKFIILHQGFPGVNGHYLFFLERYRQVETSRYYIATAYQLKDGEVFPIDDAFVRYEHASETEFLKKALESIRTEKQPQ